MEGTGGTGDTGGTGGTGGTHSAESAEGFQRGSVALQGGRASAPALAGTEGDRGLSQGYQHYSECRAMRSVIALVAVACTISLGPQ